MSLDAADYVRSRIEILNLDSHCGCASSGQNCALRAVGQMLLGVKESTPDALAELLRTIAQLHNELYGNSQLPESVLDELREMFNKKLSSCTSVRAHPQWAAVYNMSTQDLQLAVRRSIYAKAVCYLGVAGQPMNIMQVPLSMQQQVSQQQREYPAVFGEQRPLPRIPGLESRTWTNPG